MARVIGADELKAGLGSAGGAVVVDVRSPKQFLARHLPKAVNIPLDYLPETLDLLPKGREIVVYGNGSESSESILAAYQLHVHAFRDVLRFAGGLRAWREAHYPLESDL